MEGISITNSERVFLVGASGSGKTELAKRLLKNLNRVLVIDPKHTFKLEGFNNGWSFINQFDTNKKNFRLFVRPKLGDDEKLFNLINKLYKKKNVTIYIDELATLTDYFPASMMALSNIARTGREKKVSVWTGTQRPRHIPLIFLTESETFFVFSLRAEADRDHVAGYGGDELKERIKPFQFWYVKSGKENPDLLTLDLPTGKIKKIRKGEVNQ